MWIKLNDTTEAYSNLVTKGEYIPGCEYPALVQTDVTYDEATAYANSVGCRLITSDEWDMLMRLRLSSVTKEYDEWASTMYEKRYIILSYACSYVGFRLVRDIPC